MTEQTAEPLPLDWLRNLVDLACRVKLTEAEGNALREALAGTVHNATAAVQGLHQRAATAEARAERAEQQLAQVRGECDAIEREQYPVADDGMAIAVRRIRAALNGAQQPECPGCGDTGACNGGPCAHPDASCDSHEPSGDSHDGAQQPETDAEGAR